MGIEYRVHFAVMQNHSRVINNTGGFPVRFYVFFLKDQMFKLLTAVQWNCSSFLQPMTFWKWEYQIQSLLDFQPKFSLIHCPLHRCRSNGHNYPPIYFYVSFCQWKRSYRIGCGDVGGMHSRRCFAFSRSTSTRSKIWDRWLVKRWRSCEYCTKIRLVSGANTNYNRKLAVVAMGVCLICGWYLFCSCVNRADGVV